MCSNVCVWLDPAGRALLAQSVISTESGLRDQGSQGHQRKRAEAEVVVATVRAGDKCLWSCCRPSLCLVSDPDRLCVLCCRATTKLQLVQAKVYHLTKRRKEAQELYLAVLNRESQNLVAMMVRIVHLLIRVWLVHALWPPLLTPGVVNHV